MLKTFDDKAHLLLDPVKGIPKIVNNEGCHGPNRLSDNQLVRDVAERKFVRVRPSLDFTPGGKAREYELVVNGYFGSNPNKIRVSEHGDIDETILNFKFLAQHFEIPDLVNEYGVNYREFSRISP